MVDVKNYSTNHNEEFPVRRLSWFSRKWAPRLLVWSRNILFTDRKRWMVNVGIGHTDCINQIIWGNSKVELSTRKQIPSTDTVRNINRPLIFSQPQLIMPHASFELPSKPSSGTPRHSSSATVRTVEVNNPSISARLQTSARHHLSRPPNWPSHKVCICSSFASWSPLISLEGEDVVRHGADKYILGSQRTFMWTPGSQGRSSG